VTAAPGDGVAAAQQPCPDCVATLSGAVARTPMWYSGVPYQDKNDLVVLKSSTRRRAKPFACSGAAFNLVGERERTDSQIDHSRRTINESFEIRVRNRKQEPVERLVKERLYRWHNWEILVS
jgi:hypothetical protein